MKLLFDNNMSHPLARALRLLSRPVTHVRDIDQLGGGATDDLILNYAASRGYCVLSKDAAIIRTAQFRAIIQEEGVGFYMLKQGRAKRLRAWDEAKLVVKAFDNIERFADATPRPFIAEVIRAGRVKRL